MGCNMSFRRTVFKASAGSTRTWPRRAPCRSGARRPSCAHPAAAARPVGADRVRAAALVRHRVHTDRLSWSYLRRRSWGEGISKARCRVLGRSRDPLSTSARTPPDLPAAFFRELVRCHVAGAVALVVSVLFAGGRYPGEVGARAWLGRCRWGSWDRSVGTRRRFPCPARVSVLTGWGDCGLRRGCLGGRRCGTDGLWDLPAIEDEPQFDRPPVTVVVPVPDAGAGGACVRSVLADGVPEA